ncbi:PREDICTED: anthocyanidin 3-O-glucoside 2''-O-glucosyltransferase-like [Fragaria vesca subsp. vesca]|uniref:anthocyanidin 3-O-glucoside 2''-O-glucosyltransferase-like n=1 Tax=Fragaria vesca subsp. vesca TaxID=101020 RepID=UPI0002C336A1|nr:PREDICTED: anthocyanidin 3-O-glucoside 2''-O-glucosyltransferase-like [Fragaria vesca subsp. vesca]XP_011465894.1 PREDICTED: anthocyanidin 3-O-glucoside 2''-O-glucosyltransferase-like [Fragaria vesca subsp. vesca]
MSSPDRKTLHIAMYPWFAMGHLSPFLHISNKLAERGHRISFFLPQKTQAKLQYYNLHPDLITFYPLTIPHVEGLPQGAETTADVPFPLHTLVVTAMDLTRPQIEKFLRELKPDLVFYDFSHWLPQLLRELDGNIKSVLYCIISPVTIGYLLSPERKLTEKPLVATDLLEAPTSFPSSIIKLRTHEARGLTYVTNQEYGRGVTFLERQLTSLGECDAIGFKTCREFEGKFCDYIEEQMKKPVILAGPVVPAPPSSALEERWAEWLGGFEPGSVIYCAFGSECVLKKKQLQELVLGFELTGLPFFAALKTPVGLESIEAALPEGFEERVKGRGVVHSGWVQQPLILNHPSVGYFVTHCGSGSLAEAMMNHCRLVLLPHVGDQIINARMMGGDLRVGVEVEKGDEDGLFSKEGVCKAVEAVMDDESEVGKEVKANHAKWREFFSNKGLEKTYIDCFEQRLHQLLEC